MLLTGTGVYVTARTNEEGVVLKFRRGADDTIQYLVEFKDDTRQWFHHSWVKTLLPERKVSGDVNIGRQIDVYETEDWTTVKVNSTTVYDHHNLDGKDMLDILDIEHTYAYYDDVDQFRQAVGEENTSA